jgi:hypothetical protein
MNPTQQQAFQQGAAWQQAYSLLFLGKQAKLFKQNGQWYCEEIK